MSSILCLRPPASDGTVLITRVNLNPLCGLVEFWGNFGQQRKAAYARLAEDIQSPGKIFHDLDGNPGDLCLVRVDETWLRARIVSKNVSNYSVYLIDKGFMVSANTCRLAWGQNHYFHLPPEVEFCVLSNVLPLSPTKRWSPMALEFLKSLSGKSVTAYIQDVLGPQRTVVLQIPSISKQMYEMGFAKMLTPEMFKNFVLASLQSHNNPVTSPESPQHAEVDRPLAVCEQKKKDHFMYPELQNGTVETVIVTEVTDPLRIFCQLKVFSHELNKLTERLTDHYEGRLGASLVRPDMLGTPCAARGSDGRWHRSVLQQVFPDNNVAEVLLVDYGQKRLVEIENIRQLAPEFFRMPVVAYVCSLHGVINKVAGWTAAQVDYLRSLLLFKTMIAKFEYQSVSEGVNYVTLYGDENTNMNAVFGSKVNCRLESEKSLRDYAIHRDQFRPEPPRQMEILGNIPGPTKAPKDTEQNMVINVKGNFPVEDLPPNSSHMAVVQHVSNPFEFWIQTQKYADRFNELMDGIADLYTDPIRDYTIRNPTVGLYCAAKAQDDVFYRATVTEVSETKIRVYFVDYGNIEMVNRNSIRVLPDKFKELPQLALKCKLSDIKPKDGRWSHKATNFFTGKVADKVLDIHVKANDNGVYIVQVTDSAACGERDISKLMCISGFAENDEAERKPTMTIRPAIKPTTLNPFALPFDSCKGENYAEMQSAEPHSTESKPALKEHIFPIGSVLEVNVSHIESPNDFWCQLEQNTRYLNCLMQDMQAYYEGSQFRCPLDEVCVAQHPDNGKWYRALVIQKHGTHDVDVLLVDYGQKIKVPMYNLREIIPAFLNLKGQAFRCSLYSPINPTSIMNDWSEDAVIRFQNLVDTVSSSQLILKCTIHAVMYNDQGIVFNLVGLETPFESICMQMLDCAERTPLIKTPATFYCLDTYCYSTHNIKTGTEEKVKVTCVNNVGQFYCQLERNADIVQRLAVRIDAHCCKLKNSNPPKTIGPVCFAKYTDGHWYRGQIKATQPSILVHFVDYGNTIEVDKSDLLQIPKDANDIMSVPIQAVECCLSDMPVNVPDEVNKWFETVATDYSFTALVVAKEADGKLQVELYSEKTRVNTKIKEKFCAEVNTKEQVICQSKWGLKDTEPTVISKRTYQVGNDTKPQTSKPHQCVAPMQKHIMGEGTKPLKYYQLSSPNPQQMKEKGNKRHRLSEPYVIPHQRQSSAAMPNCMGNITDPVEVNAKPKPENSSTESQPLIAGNVPVIETQNKDCVAPKPKTKTLSMLTDLPLKSLKSGMEADVFVSHCNSPLSFYVQFVKDENDIFSIVEKLNDGHSATETVDINDVHPGDLVNAEFPDDSSWYRAVVKEIHENNADVEFIDFGNTATIPISKMCVLPKPLLQMPRFSTHCLLTGAAFHGNKKELDPEIVSTFKEDVGTNGDKELQCRFERQVGSMWEVSLEDCGHSLTCKMPSSGSAVLSDVTTDMFEQVEENPCLSSTTSETPTQKATLNIQPLRYGKLSFSVGQSLEAYVATINCPQSFWCQLVNSEELDKIAESISEFGKADQHKTVDVNSLSDGNACIALFPDDQQWYRAEVINKDGDMLSIQFVDYGNEAQVNLKNIKEMPPELIEAPSQAFLCQLEGFDASCGSWDDNAVDHLAELIVDKLLKLTVVRVSTEEDSRDTFFVQVECEGQVINGAMKAHWKSVTTEKNTDNPEFVPNTTSLPCEEIDKPDTRHSEGDLGKTIENLILPEAGDGIPLLKSCEDSSEQSTDCIQQLIEDVIIQAADETSELANYLESSHCFEDLEPIAGIQKEEKNQIPSGLNMPAEGHPFTQSQNLKEMDPNRKEEMERIPTIDDCLETINDTSDIDDGLETKKCGMVIVSSLEKGAGSDDSDHPLDSNIVEPTALYVGQSQCMEEVARFCIGQEIETEAAVTEELRKDQECGQVSEEEAETLVAVVEDAAEEPEATEKNSSDIMTGSEFGPIVRAADTLPVGSMCIVRSPAVNSWCKAKVIRNTSDYTLVLLIDHDAEMMVDPDSIFEPMVSEPRQNDSKDCADSDTSSDTEHREGDSADTIVDLLTTMSIEDPEDCDPEENSYLHKVDSQPTEPNQVQEGTPSTFSAQLDLIDVHSEQVVDTEDLREEAPNAPTDKVVETEDLLEEAPNAPTDKVVETEDLLEETPNAPTNDQDTTLVEMTCPDRDDCTADVCIVTDNITAVGELGNEEQEPVPSVYSEEKDNRTEENTSDEAEEQEMVSDVGLSEMLDTKNGHTVPTQHKSCLPCTPKEHLGVKAATEEQPPEPACLEPADEVLTEPCKQHARTEDLKGSESEEKLCFSDDDSLETQTSMLTHLCLLIGDDSDSSVIFVSETPPPQQLEE